jgi:hypothetical protein
MALRHVDRIAGGKGESYLKGFETLVEMAKESGGVTAELKLGWDREDDEYDEDDYIPEIVLRVRKPSE